MAEEPTQEPTKEAPQSDSDSDAEEAPPAEEFQRHEDEGVGFDMIGAVHTESQQKKEDEAIEEFADYLSKKKKKKKKSKKSKKSKATAAATAATDETIAADGSVVTSDGVTASEDASDNTQSDIKPIATLSPANYYSQSDDRPYPYTVLLDRIFRELKQNNPALMDREKHQLPPPATQPIGSKKTGWGNFKSICDKLHRKPEHVKLFFLVEMNTAGNLDGNENLLLKGRWRPKQIESLLKKYIKEYVTCQNCKSPDTGLTRDNATRLHILKCGVCGASRSVRPITKGFHATTREDRRAARQGK